MGASDRLDGQQGLSNDETTRALDNDEELLDEAAQEDREQDGARKPSHSRMG
jgi:hypothetical protein